MAWIERQLKRGLLIGAVLVACAFAHNHYAHPCVGHQVGAGGMCVPVAVSAEGTR
jgi:hypothetical protein